MAEMMAAVTDAPVCPHGEHPAVCMDCLFENPHPVSGRDRRFVPPGGAVGTEKLCDLADVTPRQIVYWIERGVVVPGIHLAAGSGDTHWFSAEDVRLVATLGALARLGCKVENLGPFSRWWNDNEPPTGAHVAVVPDGGAVVLDPVHAALDLDRFSPCWVVPAGG